MSLHNIRTYSVIMASQLNLNSTSINFLMPNYIIVLIDLFGGNGTVLSPQKTELAKLSTNVDGLVSYILLLGLLSRWSNLVLCLRLTSISMPIEG